MLFSRVKRFWKRTKAKLRSNLHETPVDQTATQLPAPVTAEVKRVGVGSERPTVLANAIQPVQRHPESKAKPKGVGRLSVRRVLLARSLSKQQDATAFPSASDPSASTLLRLLASATSQTGRSTARDSAGSLAEGLQREGSAACSLYSVPSFRSDVGGSSTDAGSTSCSDFDNCSIQEPRTTAALSIQRTPSGLPVINKQYLLVKRLGEGAYGKVKLVLNLQDMRLYAIKFISKRHIRSFIMRMSKSSRRSSAMSAALRSAAATSAAHSSRRSSTPALAHLKRTSMPARLSSVSQMAERACDSRAHTADSVVDRSMCTSLPLMAANRARVASSCDRPSTATPSAAAVVTIGKSDDEAENTLLPPPLAAGSSKEGEQPRGWQHSDAWTRKRHRPPSVAATFPPAIQQQLISTKISKSRLSGGVSAASPAAGAAFFSSIEDKAVERKAAIAVSAEARWNSASCQPLNGQPAASQCDSICPSAAVACGDTQAAADLIPNPPAGTTSDRSHPSAAANTNRLRSRSAVVQPFTATDAHSLSQQRSRSLAAASAGSSRSGSQQVDAAVAALRQDFLLTGLRAIVRQHANADAGAASTRTVSVPCFDHVLARRHRRSSITLARANAAPAPAGNCDAGTFAAAPAAVEGPPGAVKRQRRQRSTSNPTAACKDMMAATCKDAACRSEPASEELTKRESSSNPRRPRSRSSDAASAIVSSSVLRAIAAAAAAESDGPQPTDLKAASMDLLRHDDMPQGNEVEASVEACGLHDFGGLSASGQLMRDAERLKRIQSTRAASLTISPFAADSAQHGGVAAPEVAASRASDRAETSPEPCTHGSSPPQGSPLTSAPPPPNPFMNAAGSFGAAADPSFIAVAAQMYESAAVVIPSAPAKVASPFASAADCPFSTSGSESAATDASPRGSAPLSPFATAAKSPFATASCGASSFASVSRTLHTTHSVELPNPFARASGSRSSVDMMSPLSKISGREDPDCELPRSLQCTAAADTPARSFSSNPNPFSAVAAAAAPNPFSAAVANAADSAAGRMGRSREHSTQPLQLIRSQSHGKQPAPPGGGREPEQLLLLQLPLPGCWQGPVTSPFMQSCRSVPCVLPRLDSNESWAPPLPTCTSATAAELEAASLTAAAGVAAAGRCAAAAAALAQPGSNFAASAYAQPPPATSEMAASPLIGGASNDCVASIARRSTIGTGSARLSGSVARLSGSVARLSGSAAGGNDVAREISVLRKLDHPNVVNLVEVIDDPQSDSLLLVMEHVQGGSLEQQVTAPAPEQRWATLPEPLLLRFVHEICQGLQYLHAHSVVHGDLKPANLLRGTDGRIKLVDFGSALVFNEAAGAWDGQVAGTPAFRAPESLQQGCTLTTKVAGTPAFRAPESLQQGCNLTTKVAGTPAFRASESLQQVCTLTTKVDVWSLGVCMYQWAFGRLPFTGSSTPEVFEAIGSQPLVLPPDASCSPALAAIITSALQKDPDSRCSVEQLMQEAAAAAAHHPPMPWQPQQEACVSSGELREAMNLSIHSQLMEDLLPIFKEVEFETGEVLESSHVVGESAILIIVEGNIDTVLLPAGAASGVPHLPAAQSAASDDFSLDGTAIGCMSLGSMTNMLGEVPRPVELGGGQTLLETHGPGQFLGLTSVLQGSQAAAGRPVIHRVRSRVVAFETCSSEMTASMKRNPALADLLARTAWQQSSESTICQVVTELHVSSAAAMAAAASGLPECCPSGLESIYSSGSSDVIPCIQEDCG